MNLNKTIERSGCCMLLALAFGVSSNAQNLPFSSDALVYYPFSGNAQNQAGSSYNLAVNGAVLTSDRFGTANSAYRFDGVDDYLVSAQMLPDIPEFTLSAWIKPEADVPGAIFYDAQFFLPGEDFIVSVQSGGTLYGIADKGPTGGPLTAPNVIKTGVWQHIAMSAKSGLIALYVNGSLVASSSVGGNNVGYHSIFYIGAENHGLGPGNFFRGSIDEFVLYRRVLSANEIASLAAPGASPNAPSFSTQPISQTVVAGQSVNFYATATGASPLTYQWRKNGNVIVGATAASLNITSVQATDAGEYSITVSNSVGQAVSSPAILTVRPSNPGRLVNLSVRSATSAGNGTLIVGFVIGGAGTAGSMAVLTRASGPALKQFGISDTIADPVLNIFDGARLIASNDNWIGTDVSAVAASVGAFGFPAGSKDAAIGASFLGSNYTSQVFDASGLSGITLVELYDTNSAYGYTRPRLINVSARGVAGSGDSTMIAGFVIKGDSPLTVLIRGIGPGLSQFGVSGVLANPRLALRLEGKLVTINDNWWDVGAAMMSATMASVGAFSLPANSMDSAILATLQPGLYTVEVSGVNSTPGVALVEIYEVP